MCEPLHLCLKFRDELVDRHASIAAILSGFVAYVDDIWR